MNHESEGYPELRSCVKVEVAVLGFPSLISMMVSVDVKQHFNKPRTLPQEKKKQSSGAM